MYSGTRLPGDEVEVDLMRAFDGFSVTMKHRNAKNAPVKNSRRPGFTRLRRIPYPPVVYDPTYRNYFSQEVLPHLVKIVTVIVYIHYQSLNLISSEKQIEALISDVKETTIEETARSMKCKPIINHIIYERKFHKDGRSILVCQRMDVTLIKSWQFWKPSVL